MCIYRESIFQEVKYSFVEYSSVEYSFVEYSFVKYSFVECSFAQQPGRHWHALLVLIVLTLHKCARKVIIIALTDDSSDDSLHA